ncbi:SgcJ/EcaC family oxidoreductase [Nocardia cyriacigeorgica]|uniref:SgcJ/EcaC family oxidoreductase n=1 Tax=Nocardia cyriacigeorgica TaxID=135487 RepID=A0A5R8NE10_9NOCA|nr:SgcJ/EcaC family oxidoreductase [Nocardia cyriacigeorgica]TLF73900.1 SgcJ/EcaC family oxidoreductase [Nocardia cyriacigeorgica]
MSIESTQTSYEPTERATEIAAIRAVVDTVAHAQANELVDEFTGLFREDAVWTTGHGKRLFGRPAIAEFTAKVLPGATANGTATYEVEHIAFLRPDVAAVKIRQRYLTHDGELVSEGSPLYVMTKEAGRWTLTAGQNTPVVAE